LRQPELAPTADETVIDKDRSSGFIAAAPKKRLAVF